MSTLLRHIYPVPLECTLKRRRTALDSRRAQREGPALITPGQSTSLSIVCQNRLRTGAGRSRSRDHNAGQPLSLALISSAAMAQEQHRRRRAGGIIWRPCARTSWCRSRSNCRLYRGTIDCERLGFKTIKLSPAACRARSKCKLQIIYAAERGLCGNASNSSAAICSNKWIRSTTRPAAGVRRGGVAADPLPDADTPEYYGSGTIHDPIMMRFCALWISGR
jgi:hypothetical protein